MPPSLQCSLEDELLLLLVHGRHSPFRLTQPSLALRVTRPACEPEAEDLESLLHARQERLHALCQGQHTGSFSLVAIHVPHPVTEAPILVQLQEQGAAKHWRTSTPTRLPHLAQ